MSSQRPAASKVNPLRPTHPPTHTQTHPPTYPPTRPLTHTHTHTLPQVADIEGAEKEKMAAKVASILRHSPNAFTNRQLIYDYPQQLFADAGVMAIEHVDFDGTERLALVLGERGWVGG